MTPFLTIRDASYSELPVVSRFISTHFKDTHLYSRHPESILFYHSSIDHLSVRCAFDSSESLVATQFYVRHLINQQQHIHGMLFTAADSSPPSTGLHLIQSLLSERPHSYIATGVNHRMVKYNQRIGLTQVPMCKFSLINPGLQSYKLISNITSKPSISSRALLDWENLSASQLTQLLCLLHEKEQLRSSPQSYLHRYLLNPFHQYLFFYSESRQQLVFCRRRSYLSRYVIKVVEIVGQNSTETFSLPYLAPTLFLDSSCEGLYYYYYPYLSDLSPQGDCITVPEYFNPYSPDEVSIHTAFQLSSPYIIQSCDADQDRAA